MSELAEGKKAPAFKMAANGGREVSSASLKGKPFLLYFYPKADTPGCTKQACGVQEALPQLGKLGLTVIGVSPDAMPPIEKFAKKYGLEFALASDPEHKTAEAYGVWVDAGIRPEEVWAELARRRGISGLAEKAARPEGIIRAAGTTKLP